MSQTSLRSCKPTSPLSTAMCSPTLLHAFVPKTCPTTHPLVNHISSFSCVLLLQFVPVAFYWSSSQLTFLLNSLYPTAASVFQITSAQFDQLICHCTAAHGLWSWTCFLQHLARELCPRRAAAPNCNINKQGGSVTMETFSRATRDNSYSDFQSWQCLSTEYQAAITTEWKIVGISS